MKFLSRIASLKLMQHHIRWFKDVENDDTYKLFQDYHSTDRFQGRLAKEKDAKRRRCHKAWIRKLLQILHNVNEFHEKLATWLCENYHHRVVLIPTFETQRMVVRKRN